MYHPKTNAKGKLQTYYSYARIRTSDAQKKSDAPTHVARVKYCCCNYYFFMLRSGCCMKHYVNVAVGIFHLRIGYQNHLYTYFLDVASADFWCLIVIYQCCDGPFDEKNLIRALVVPNKQRWRVKTNLDCISQNYRIYSESSITMSKAMICIILLISQPFHC